MPLPFYNGIRTACSRIGFARPARSDEFVSMAKKRSSATTPSTPTSDSTAASRGRTTRRAAATTNAPAAIDGTAVADLAAASRAAEMSALAGEPASRGGAPSVDEIAVAAYHRYLQRGGQDGYALDDWIAAEHDLRQRSSH